MRVYDEARDAEQSFTCPADVLVKSMRCVVLPHQPPRSIRHAPQPFFHAATQHRYFEPFLRGASCPLELAVHCDLEVFSFLFRKAQASRRHAAANAGPASTPARTPAPLPHGPTRASAFSSPDDLVRDLPCGEAGLT